MRCHICDRVLDAPSFNSDHEEYDPCEPCLLVIQDTLDSFEDKPYAEEDALQDPVPMGSEWSQWFVSEKRHEED